MGEKQFKTENFFKVSELIKFMNAKHLQKEDIISIIPISEFVYLIYMD